MGDFTVTIQVWTLCSVYFIAKNSSNLLVLTNIGPHKVENPLKWLLFVSPCVSDCVFCLCVCISVCLLVYMSVCCLSVRLSVSVFLHEIRVLQVSQNNSLEWLIYFGSVGKQDKSFYMNWPFVWQYFHVQSSYQICSQVINMGIGRTYI